MRFKYPRTNHLPWSPGLQNDDRRIENLNSLIGQEIIVTEKLDGENTSLYCDGMHARSLDSRHHPSRDWIKKFHGSIAHDIPEGVRICGENMYAKHSIAYNNLKSYFYGFSVWQGEVNLSWDDTLIWFKLLGIEPVPTIYRGRFDLKLLEQLCAYLDPFNQEGLVVRVTNEIVMDDWQHKAAKWVRKGHIQTDEHWMLADIVPNKLEVK